MEDAEEGVHVQDGVEVGFSGLLPTFVEAQVKLGTLREIRGRGHLQRLGKMEVVLPEVDRETEDVSQSLGLLVPVDAEPLHRGLDPVQQVAQGGFGLIELPQSRCLHVLLLRSLAEEVDPLALVREILDAELQAPHLCCVVGLQLLDLLRVLLVLLGGDVLGGSNVVLPLLSVGLVLLDVLLNLGVVPLLQRLVLLLQGRELLLDSLMRRGDRLHLLAMLLSLLPGRFVLGGKLVLAPRAQLREFLGLASQLLLVQILNFQRGFAEVVEDLGVLALADDEDEDGHPGVLLADGWLLSKQRPIPSCCSVTLGSKRSECLALLVGGCLKTARPHLLTDLEIKHQIAVVRFRVRLDLCQHPLHVCDVDELRRSRHERLKPCETLLTEPGRLLDDRFRQASCLRLHNFGYQEVVSVDLEGHAVLEGLMDGILSAVSSGLLHYQDEVPRGRLTMRSIRGCMTAQISDSNARYVGRRAAQIMPKAKR